MVYQSLLCYISNFIEIPRRFLKYLSRLMRKPKICIGENKHADHISAFIFATRIVQSLFFLNPKFHASSLLMWLYSLICVRPVRKPYCWFSHETAHFIPILASSDETSYIFEPPRGKTNNVVSEQVRHKPACTSTEKSLNLEISDLSRRGTVLSE